MKLLFITPGSGDNFYCENCMRDRELVKALSRAGADVAFMPLYLPVELENAGLVESGTKIQTSPLFFGGINAWLDQNVPGWSKMPGFVRNWLDNRRLLTMAGQSSVAMTNPEKLGSMTLSMLQGSDGKQKRQLGELIKWLSQPDNRPDAVILSNALLGGIASELVNLPISKDGRQVQVFCLLQDEDSFLDSLGRWSEACWRQMKENNRYISRYIAVSGFYAGLMRQQLAVADDKVAMCYSGVNFADYAGLVRKGDGVPTVGYLSRICRANGFDRLVNGFVALRKLPGYENARLIVSGGEIGANDFIAEQKRLLGEHGALHDVEFRAGFRSLADRLKFFADIDVLCVPQRGKVAHGRFCLESLAAGVPMIVPACGVYPELLQAGGGRLCTEPELENLALILAEVFKGGTANQPDMVARSREKYDIAANANEMIKIISGVLK